MLEYCSGVVESDASDVFISFATERKSLFLFYFKSRSILECKNVLDKIPQDKLCRLTQNIIKVQ